MNYKVKLLVLFLGVAVVTNAISLTVMDRHAVHYLYEGYRAKLLSITETTATMLDGDLLKTIQTRDDENTAAYSQLRATLRRVRDANRRSDTYMKRVFAVRKSTDSPGTLLVAVDPEENPSTAAHAGEVYRPGAAAIADVSKATVEESFVTDEFGTFLRSWAPVFDRSGNFAGAVVVEAPIGWVESRMTPVRITALLSMLLAIAIAVPSALALSRRVSRPLLELKGAVKRIGEGDLEARVPVLRDDEFGHVAHAVNAMAAGLKERDRVKSTFAHYVSQQVLDSILKSPDSLQLSGDRRRITVLFCDIRGFSTISEKLPPEKVVRLLNEYFECMVDVVFRNKGMLDKFIGDGMMVLFGAPEDDPYQEENALRTAIEMRQELRRLSERWQAEGIAIRNGVGINSGPAVVGNIGSTRRMDYTAIGDTVNLASRLESATKDLGVGILVSEYTYIALKGSFRFREMGSIRVKGRTDPVQTYTLEEPEGEVVST
ncbi:MAG: HAMP domain-containing protein [Acidobacteriota bacterium]|nr:HAMP domain-containing protein [Acidobacteriota bacterium]